ncbi:MAG: hypothetical protein MJY59_00010 [Bacteroidaceae bacterium]|nr:hypothetical protein [Bacteroidaceae bacterium]
MTSSVFRFSGATELWVGCSPLASPSHAHIRMFASLRLSFVPGSLSRMCRGAGSLVSAERVW